MKVLKAPCTFCEVIPEAALGLDWLVKSVSVEFCLFSNWPLMKLPFISKLPPSCGDVSLDKSITPLSSLDEPIVPSAILIPVTALFVIWPVPIKAPLIIEVLLIALSAILAALIASSAILFVVTEPAASLELTTAPSKILPEVTDEFCSTAVLTVLLLGVPILTVLPKTIAK